jgi:hypothetical protein
VDIRKEVKVHIFDWGRSELNSIENNNSLTDEERKNRALFWGYYVGGIDRLAFEACRHYYNRFCMAIEWDVVYCQVFDFDSNSADDFLGRCTLPLKVTSETTVNLVDNSGKEVTNSMIGGKKSTLTYSIKFRNFPPGFRLKSAWQIVIHKANNLIASDKLKGRQSSDPFIWITASSKDGEHCFRQQTTVKPKCLDAVYNETFHLPVASSANVFEETLGKVSPELVGLKPSVLFPPEKNAASARGTWRRDLDDEALSKWTERLDAAASDISTLEPYFRGEDPFAPSQSSVKSEVSKGDSANAMKDLKEARARIEKEDVKSAENLLKAQASGLSLPVDAVDGPSQLQPEIKEVPHPVRGGKYSEDKLSGEQIDVEVSRNASMSPMCGLCGEGTKSGCGLM